MTTAHKIQQEVFRLNGAVRYSEDVDAWLSGEPAQLHALAREWFGVMRQCSDKVVELLHDGYPVACIDDVAFCYVNVYKAHVNVGFFMGAFIDDPHSLLEGSGKRMRHVKLKPAVPIDSKALTALIKQACMLATKAV